MDPLILASSAFLKKPSHIVAVSLVIVLYLLVYRLAEHRLCQRFAATHQAIRDQFGRPTALCTVPRRNQTPQPSAASCHRYAHLRQVIEVVSSQLALQFHIETNHAHSFWDLTARLYTKLTAHMLFVWLNRLLGVPDLLRLKCLAFPNN